MGRHDVQLFATPHSEECIHAAHLAYYAVEYGSEFR